MKKTIHEKDEQINFHLIEHIDNDESDGWEYKPMVQLLNEWAGIFTERFRLQIPTPAIGVEKLRKTRIAQYNPSRDKFAVKWTITMNSQWMTRPLYRTLCTLLHECLHVQQHIHGNPGAGNHHNVQFRFFAEKFGLLITNRGRTSLIQGLFTELLDEHDIEWEEFDIQDTDDPNQTRTKKQKWTCECKKITVSLDIGDEADLKCLNCNRQFKPVREK